MERFHLKKLNDAEAKKKSKICLQLWRPWIIVVVIVIIIIVVIIIILWSISIGLGNVLKRI
jgi:hypothetical protein